MTDPTAHHSGDEPPKYTPCKCSHIEPEHEPNAGECYSCDCAAYRPTPAVPQAPADQTAFRDRIAAALYEHSHPGWALRYADLDQDQRDTYLARADAVLAALPAPVDRAAVLREAADLLAAKRQVYGAPGANIHRRSPLRVQGMADAEAELRRVADETAATETPEWDRPETEEEKLAKCRRMAKALSAPPVAPPEWETTTQWPGRHKRPGDRRVHATARFIVNDTQWFWTACGEHVGRGGTPMSHMPVDCRGCKRATAAGARQDGVQTS